jgi:hypothetical protein
MHSEVAGTPAALLTEENSSNIFNGNLAGN